jgi:hypothetical protein
MNDLDLADSKEQGHSATQFKTTDSDLPIKKCYYLEGKYFIVIDKTIAELLNFSAYENTELYFQQEVINGDCIVLRPYKMRE